jgi:hypothetical protein
MKEIKINKRFVILKLLNAKINVRLKMENIIKKDPLLAERVDIDNNNIS